MAVWVSRVGSIRSYATRIAERPKFRHSDPLINNPHAKVTQHADGLTFIERPPPTAPSPFSLTTEPASPLLRRPSRTSPASSSAQPPPSTSTGGGVADGASTGAADSALPAPVSKEHTFARLTDEQIMEMRALRLKDPQVWTRLRLARQFGCSPAFVGMFAHLKKSEIRTQKAKFEAQIAASRAKWGEQKQLAEAIRRKRRGFW